MRVYQARFGGVTRFIGLGPRVQLWRERGYTNKAIRFTRYISKQPGLQLQLVLASGEDQRLIGGRVGLPLTSFGG